MKIFGINVIGSPRAEIVNKIASVLDKRETAAILYANVHVLNEVYKSRELKQIFNSSPLIINDSAGLSFFAKLKRNQLSKNTITDLKDDLFRLLEQRGERVFLFGSTTSVLEDLVTKLESNYSGLKIVGYHQGFFSQHENKFIVETIREAKPSIIILGMGVPKQEFWFEMNKQNFPNVVFFMGGNCFSYWSGKVKRAPIWMRDMGLEWLFRLFQEPKRLSKRYLLGNPLFLIRFIKSELFNE